MDKVHYVGCLMASYGGNLLCRLGKKLHTTISPATINCWVPPGRRPLRIHELRKFTKVTGQSCKDIRLIVLTYFRSSLTLREPMNQPCGSCDGATPCVAWVHRHTRSRYSRSREPMNLDIASSQEIVILPTSKREIKLRLKGR